MREKRTVYPKENNKETIKELKGRIRRLDKDKRKLISEVKTLQRAFDRNIEIIQQLRNASLKEIQEIIDEID